MKRFLFFIFLLISVQTKSQTSVYHPFPDSGAVWNFHFWLFCAEAEYSLVLGGDTVINSITYHKTFIPYVLSLIPGPPWCTLPSNGYKGALRHDSAARKVYYVPASMSSEQILYDFNLQVGDTVPGYLESWGGLPVDTVISIDSILVGGNYRKRWNINNSYDIHIIEGLGSTYGLVEPSPGGILDGPDYRINCFSLNGQVLYPDTAIACPLITGMHHDETPSSFCNLLPNPFPGKGYLEAGPGFDHAELLLLSMDGRMICQYPVKDRLTFLDLEEYPKGFYFLQLTAGNGSRITTKLVLQ